MKKLFLIFQLLIIAAVCTAQADSSKMEVAITARSYADHIVLRYFSTTPALFNKANSEGYIIERAEYKPGISFANLLFKPIKGSPFKRWSEEKWIESFKQGDKSDSNNLKLAGFAMILSDPDGNKSSADVMENGLKSLKQEIDNQNTRFGFAVIASNRSKMAAEGMALRVDDNDVTLGTEYVYRVGINEPSANNTAEMGYVRIKCKGFNEKYLVNNKAVKINEVDMKVSFSFPESLEYYAFNVERSDDSGISFKKITSEPVLKLKQQGYTGTTDYGYSDSGLINYKKYTYRLYVSTLYADDLLLSEFTAMPRDKRPPSAPFLKSAKHIKPNQVQLTWEMREKPDDLKGFNIKRSDSLDGIYKLISKTILPSNSVNYIDEKFDREGSNFYVVEAIDTAGNISRSLSAYVTLIDSTPPARPIIASAKIDSVGKIIIKVKPNIEKDFMGYQLLKANSKDHQFSVVEETYKDSLGHTTFTLTDSTTLNTLTKKIYYQLVALDYNFNQSSPSKIIELTKRDTIAPVCGRITDFSINDSSVILTFANSSSEDATYNILLRREAGKEKFDSIFFNKNLSVTQFIDKKIVGGQTYEYAMIAKDDGGLLSKTSESMGLRTLLNDKIPTPVLTGYYDTKAKKVSLSFETDKKIKGKKIKIELYKRADNESEWVAFKIIDIDKSKGFTDDQVNGQKSMIYVIRLVDENNHTSNFSKELELQF